MTEAFSEETNILAVEIFNRMIQLRKAIVESKKKLREKQVDLGESYKKIDRERRGKINFDKVAIC